jgi:hypothetical protein
MSKTSDSPVFGCVEYVSMPQFGIDSTVAKIDTGAYSGALHCSHIEERNREPDGRRVLRFTPSENKAHTTELEEYEVTQVRSSTGHLVKRYLITTTIEIQGTTYPITIGLSNRAKMQREILIGRRFLREHGILVDTRINQELDTDGGE